MVGDIVMDDDTFALLESLFRTKKKKPTKHKELISMHVGIIKKNTTCNEIKSSKRLKGRDKRDEYAYALNAKVMQQDLKLNRYKNQNGPGFQTCLIEHFSIEVKNL